MIINGKEMDFKEGITVEEVLKNLDLNMKNVVIEVDREIIQKHDFHSRKLSLHSKVEIIRFVGGG